MTKLLLDFDGPIPARFDWQLAEVCRCLVLKCQWWRVSRSKRGWHICVSLKGRIAPISVVAIQAILGSDWRREMFNLYRARRLRRMDPWWRDKWNVLYSTKVQ